MGVGKKIGWAAFFYFVFGMLYAWLLWTGLINIASGNIVVNILYWIFYPIIMFVILFIMSGLQPIPFP